MSGPAGLAAPDSPASEQGQPVDLPRLHISGTGSPVVLLHPLGVNRHFWDPVLPGMAGMASITYDLPGHGASARRPLDTVEAMADQLAAILAISGLGRAHVVGVSLGGLVAQHFAVRYPDRIDRLILVDTVACYPPAVQQQWKQRAATARSAGMAPLIEATLATWFTPGFLSANGPVVTAVYRMLAAADPDGYAITCEALAAADTTAVASGISARTLLVCGEHDLPPFRDAAGWFAAQISRSQVAWLPEVQHAGVLEQPTAFITALRSFLAEAS